MDIFKKNIGLCHILLFVSILFNFVLGGFLYKSELQGHFIKKILIKYGIEKADIKDRPDYWAIDGWNNTIEKLDYECDVLFFGHSQIAMSDFRKYFPGKKIITSGYPGDNVEGMLLRVRQIRALKPKKIFLLCGVNSLGFSDNLFKSKYNLLINSIKRASPKSKLYIFNILPIIPGKTLGEDAKRKILDRNKFLANYSKRNNLTLIDLYSLYKDKEGNLIKAYTKDGIHLTPPNRMISGLKLLNLMWNNVI